MIEVVIKAAVEMIEDPAEEQRDDQKQETDRRNREEDRERGQRERGAHGRYVCSGQANSLERSGESQMRVRRVPAGERALQERDQFRLLRLHCGSPVRPGEHAEVREVETRADRAANQGVSARAARRLPMTSRNDRDGPAIRPGCAERGALNGIESGVAPHELQRVTKLPSAQRPSTGTPHPACPACAGCRWPSVAASAPAHLPPPDAAPRRGGFDP